MEQVREQLSQLGYSPEEIDAFFERPWEAPPEVQAILDAAAGNVFTQPTVTAEEHVARKVAAGDELVGDEQLVADRLGQDLESALARIQSGVGTEADQALVASSTAQEIQAAIQAVNAEQDVARYDWVYNELQLRPGSLDSQESLVQLYDHMVALGVIEAEPAEGEGEVADADKAATVQAILERSGGNVLVQAAVIEWARENQEYQTPREQAIINMMDAGGLRFSRAELFVNVAERLDLDPLELYNVYEGRRTNTGLEPGGKPEIRNTETRPPLLRVAKEYKEGLELYNDSKVLAAVHANDQELARRLREDPWSLDTGELRRVLDYIGGPEGKESDPQVQWLVNRLNGSYQVRTEVDSESVRDAVQTLADNWNMSDAPGVAAALAGELISEAVARARAQLPNPFGSVDDPVTVEESIQDLSAHVKARLRMLPEYQELFGNLAPGESEEEYAGRFERESQQILGDDVASVVRAGMRSGNINTIYQQALLTDAGKASTDFQELLARNARIFREML